MKPTITLPPRNATSAQEILRSEFNFVIVGANGSGKTRLGSWIESNQPAGLFVHRISAQRALSIPDFAALKNLEQAEKSLFFGGEGAHINVGHKPGNRWSSNPEISMLNDYHFLLSTLFARAAARDRKYAQDSKASGNFSAVPDSPIEIIEAAWADIMPHRKITFEDGKIMTSKWSFITYISEDKMLFFDRTNLSDWHSLKVFGIILLLINL